MQIKIKISFLIIVCFLFYIFQYQCCCCFGIVDDVWNVCVWMCVCVYEIQVWDCIVVVVDVEEGVLGQQWFQVECVVQMCVQVVAEIGWGIMEFGDDMVVDVGDQVMFDFVKNVFFQYFVDMFVLVVGEVVYVWDGGKCVEG